MHELLQVMLGRWNSLLSIKKFIEGGDLATILETLGEVQYRAAIRALRDARVSRDPRREVIIAVTQLRSAYEAFYSSATNPLSSFLTAVANLVVSIHGKEEAYKNACNAAFLTACCYKYLGDDRLVAVFCERGATAFEKYVNWTPIANAGPAGDLISYVRYVEERHAAERAALDELSKALVEN